MRLNIVLVSGYSVLFLGCKKLGAIVHLVLDSDADSFKDVHMIVSSMMVSVRQRFVELQAAIKAFMPSVCLEICELLIIRRIWQRQLDMILRLSLGSIHPVGDYFLSMWYLVPQTHLHVNRSVMHSVYWL